MSSRSLIKYIIYGILIIFIVAAIEVVSIYHKVYVSNTQTIDKEPFTLYIPTGSTYENVLDSLYSNSLVKNKESFEWAAGKKNYKAHVHSGRYTIKHNMSNNELINLLRSGKQEPVRLVINNARTLKELVGKVSRQIEPDSVQLLQFLDNDLFIEEHNFNKFSVLGMFIPNTYEVWWDIDPKGFADRMYREYQRFWTSERKAQADEIELTPNEIITLASIIINETNKEDEYHRIAGLYINRINRGIRLQADPTVIYALGDFTRQRVLTKDTHIDSPFNTYLHSGLPPGPIAIPSIKAIDAVLNHEEHNFIYFCARDDFSGYHVFAQTLEQHNRNARLYRNALNQRNILK